MSDPDYRLVRAPECDSVHGCHMWRIEKRRPIFGYSFVQHISVPAEWPDSEVVEYAMEIVHPRTINLTNPKA